MMGEEIQSTASPSMAGVSSCGNQILLKQPKQTGEALKFKELEHDCSVLRY